MAKFVFADEFPRIYVLLTGTYTGSLLVNVTEYTTQENRIIASI